MSTLLDQHFVSESRPFIRRTELAAVMNQMSSTLIVMITRGSERLTPSQLLFFTVAAEADLRGSPTTFTAIRLKFGAEAGRTFNSTYKQLFAPSLSFPKGLGWLCRVADPDDDRVKYLHLTPKGREVAEALASSSSGGLENA